MLRACYQFGIAGCSGEGRGGEMSSLRASHHVPLILLSRVWCCDFTLQNRVVENGSHWQRRKKVLPWDPHSTSEQLRMPTDSIKVQDMKQQPLLRAHLWNWNLCKEEAQLARREQANSLTLVCPKHIVGSPLPRDGAPLTKTIHQLCKSTTQVFQKDRRPKFRL